MFWVMRHRPAEARRIVVTAAVLALAGAVPEVGLAGWVPVPVLAAVVGQVPIAVRSRGGAEDRAESNVFAQPDRTVLQRLRQAEELLARKRYGEAVRLLGGILDEPEDFFFQPDPNGPVHRSLKTEAQRLLGTMPREGRQLYELQFGAEARRMLDEALTQGDPDRLAEVTRRFFHTEAGYEAAFLLGVYYYDRDQPLAAAHALARLHDEAAAESFEPTLSLLVAACWARAAETQETDWARDEMRRKAEAVLEELRRRRPEDSAWVGGRRVPLRSAEGATLQTLLARRGGPGAERDGPSGQWLMRRGDAARSSTARGGAPLLSLLWSVPTSDYPLAETVLGELGQRQAERGTAILSELFPLAVDNVVLMRSLRTLLAVDLETGKRLWEVPVDDPMAYALGFAEQYQRPPAEWAAQLAQRAWRDSIWGSITSDGTRVFSVEDLGFTAPISGPDFLMVGNRRVPNPAWPRSYNRLAAYDVQTGKLVWELGGKPGEDALPEAGSFFLGPPLPLSGRLYQLAERRGEERLLAIEAASGRVLWSQQIALVDQSIDQATRRRTAALTPSFADGILLCPTANGAVVAVELATWSLLWGFPYPQQIMTNRPHIVIQPHPPFDASATNWTDDSLILADGRVLVAPSDSPSLHCLSLLEGKPLWQISRAGDLYVACVESGRVVLVGPRRIRAVHLADGSPAWDARVVELPEESLPSGQGFASHGQYYLPLSSAEVLVIDLAEGRIARTLAARAGRVPGNLICHRGKILSHGLVGLDAFHQADVLRQAVTRTLERSPEDAKALAWRGELLLDEGNRAEGIASLRRALALADTARTRRRLREALLEGLDEEFAIYREAHGEIESLLDTPAQQARFYQLMVAGFQSQGQWKESLDYCQRLAALGHKGGVVREGRDGAVRLDRWLEVRLAALVRMAPPEVRAELDRVAHDALVSAEKADDTGPLAWVAGCYAAHPVGEEARRALVDRYVKAGRLLDAELLLWPDFRSSRPQTAAAATARLAQMLREAGRPEDAAGCYRRLADRWPDVAIDEGKTGRAIVESLPADDPVRRHLDTARIWPVGRVRIESAEPDLRRTFPYNRYPLAFVGNRRPFFVGSQPTVDQVRREFALQDEFGRPQWALDISDGERYLRFNSAASRVMGEGHLLLAWLGSRCVAIDALGGKSARVLWSRSLEEPAGLGFDDSPFLVAGGQVFFAGQQMVVLNAGRRAGMLDTSFVLTSRMLCYQQFRTCVALDPHTGETLWTRRRLPPNGTVFGDDEYVLVVPDGATEAIVLRAADGTELSGRRTIPPPEQHIATLGRRVLVWRPEGDRRVLELLDPWEQRIVWGPYRFSANAHFDLVDDEVIGLLEPDGHFKLIAIEDGRILTDADLPEESSLLSGIVLFDSGGQYTLVAQRHAQRPATRLARPVRGYLAKPADGNVYALGYDGKLLWPKPVRVRDQQILLNQPTGLPVIVLASQTYDSKRQPSRWSTTLLVIDKRTGRRLLHRSYPNQVSNLELVGNPARSRVEITLQRDKIVLGFTGEPLGPDDVEAPETLETDSPTSEAEMPEAMERLMKAFGQMWEG